MHVATAKTKIRRGAERTEKHRESQERQKERGRSRLRGNLLVGGGAGEQLAAVAKESELRQPKDLVGRAAIEIGNVDETVAGLVHEGDDCGGGVGAAIAADA